MAPTAPPRARQMRMDAAVAEPEVESDWKGAAAWSAGFAEPEPIFDILKIKEILPHRYPFLLVDKVIEFEPGKKAVGVKKVTANEEFFNGHFPNRPIMPGVLQVEAMAQVGGIVALQEPVTDGKGDFFFAGVNNVKWRRPVVPGDTLVMEMELTAFKARFGLVKMKGTCYVDGNKVLDDKLRAAPQPHASHHLPCPHAGDCPIPLLPRATHAPLAPRDLLRPQVVEGDFQFAMVK